MNFANTWSVLFCVLSAIPLFCQSRRLVQEEVVNGAYKLHTHCLAQFVVTLPLNFLAVLVYEAVLHWMVGFNDWFPSYIYAVLLAWAVLQCFDGVLLCVTEMLRHPMLVASFSMVTLGFFALFAGFFTPQETLAPAVRWVPFTTASCKWGMWVGVLERDKKREREKERERKRIGRSRAVTVVARKCSNRPPVAQARVVVHPPGSRRRFACRLLRANPARLRLTWQRHQHAQRAALQRGQRPEHRRRHAH